MRETCVLVDGHSLMYRAFHALPPMDADGVPTNAVHGFLSMLLKCLEDYRPQYCIVTFDEHGEVFRHQQYADYKLGRAPMPDTLIPQFAVMREILEAMGVKVMSLPGYEADDLIGTLSLQFKQKGVMTLILSGDKDDLQLVDDDVHMLFTRKGDIERLDPTQVKALFGVTPEQVTAWKGLMGDPSDNIPGVPGVGDKTAVKLLAEYGTLENVLASAEGIKGKVGENLRAFRAQALMSRELATIRRDLDISATLRDASLDRLTEGLPTMAKYQLNTASDRVRRLVLGAAAAQAPQEAPAPEEWEELDTLEGLAAFLAQGKGTPVAIFTDGEEMSVALPGGLQARVLVKPAQQSLLEEPAGVPLDGALRLATAHEGGFVTHNAKALYHLMGLPEDARPDLRHCTMLGAYLHNAQERSYALQHFAARSARGVQDLYIKQQAQLRDTGMEELYRTVELPLVRVLYAMEVLGFRVDPNVLQALGREYTARAEALRRDIYELTGVAGFNINSPQQLGKVLFETLGLPAQRKTKSGFSTDAEVLETLAELHPAVSRVLDFRQVTKLQSTYVDALLRKTDPGGRIHTTFEQTGTSTGRISSAEPNLQNIPIRTQMGRDIRKAFVAAPGHVLVDGDYSQIELRVLAHISGDEAMCDAFLKGQDIHTRTAAEIHGIPLEKVTREMRSDAKAVNFGIVYGISDFGLSRSIGTTRRRAAEFIARYLERYPGVRRYMEESVRLGQERGYTATLLGRRRSLEELKSGNAVTRGFGVRIAMNTPIQGTSADIIKAAMVRADEALRSGGYAARLILTVHDELIIEAPEAEAEGAAQLLKESMEGVIRLRVPLLCEVRIGKNWYDTK